MHQRDRRGERDNGRERADMAGAQDGIGRDHAAGDEADGIERGAGADHEIGKAFKLRTKRNQRDLDTVPEHEQRGRHEQSDDG